MAFTIGSVTCGFVTSAPTADPGAANIIADDTINVVSDTTPAGAARITEIGWYCDGASEEANFMVGLYASDGTVVPGEAGTLLYSDTTNAKGTDAGWKVVSVDWEISENTRYWIAITMDATATDTSTNRGLSGGSGRDARSGLHEFTNPFGGGALLDADGTVSIYAVYEEGTPSASNPGNIKQRQAYIIQ